MNKSIYQPSPFIPQQSAIVCKQIAECVEASGIGPSELARRLGTSRSQTHRILNGEGANLTIESLERIAHVLGVRLTIKFEVTE